MCEEYKFLEYKCAVLLATYNGAEFIGEQLSTYQIQTGCNLQVYFSDDCSTDGTQKIISDSGAIDLNPIKIKFGSSARNFFYLIQTFNEECQHDYIVLSDQDDIWLPNKLSHAITVMQETESDVYSGSYYSFQELNSKIKYVNKAYQQTPRSHFFRSPGPGFTYVLTKSAFKEIKKQIEKMEDLLIRSRWHDWSIYAIAKDLELSWYIDKKPLALYRLHGKNDTGQLNSFEQLRKRFKFLFDGRFRAQILLNMQLCKSTDEKVVLQGKFERFTFYDRIRILKHLSEMRSSNLQRLGLFVWLVLGDVLHER